MTTDFFETAMADMEDSLVEDQSTIDSEEWDPKNAGEALQGIFIKAEPKATKYGLGYNVVIKDIHSGTYVKVWCKRSMLRGQLLDAQPKAGTEIAFKYNGLQESQQGNDYHSYQVRAAQADPEAWHALMAKGAALQQEYDTKGGGAAPAATVTNADLEAPY